MSIYKVKLMYMYSDTVEVEADSKDEAIEKASKDETIEEVFESFYDAEATRLSDV